MFVFSLGSNIHITIEDQSLPMPENLKIVFLRYTLDGPKDDHTK